MADRRREIDESVARGRAALDAEGAKGAKPNERNKKKPNGPTTFPKPEDRPKYVVLDDRIQIDGRERRPGVYFCGMTAAKKDAEPTPFEKWVCTPLHIDAVTHNGHESDFGRLLRFKNTNGHWREWAMPMEMLAGDAVVLREELLAMGVSIDPKDRALLSAYLQSTTPERRLHCALQVGWCGKSFVLPDTVIGPDAGEVVFQTGEREHAEFTSAGTVEGWRTEIAARAVGNSILVCTLSAAFAGPLLERCNGESGGVHLVGRSSIGKSVGGEASCSVWGGPTFKRSWRTTANGLEGAAAMFNDSLFVLDELNEADPRDIATIIYALGNGCGKQRADRNGRARSVTRWRCFVVSTGEQTPETRMAEANIRIQAGQRVRLLDIPVTDRRFGTWDELHGFVDGEAFSNALRLATKTHYGHAGRAFLDKLTRDERDLCALLERVKALPEFSGDAADGQERRAAARLALLALAGELATEYEITGWPEGAAIKAAAELFRLWRNERGKGPDERRQICQQVSGFVERHGDARFSSVDADSEKYPVRDRAGWWQHGDAGREYLFTAEGMREALKGFDFKRALDVLQEVGALPAPGANGERATPRRIAGRVVKVYPISIEEL